MPLELRHLFWNTAPRQLDVDTSGGYIARRLIQTGDLDGLAWGAEQLTADDWQARRDDAWPRSEEQARARRESRAVDDPMTLPENLLAVLPADTAASWEELAPLVPKTAYLFAGGTALAVHLHHLCQSRPRLLLPREVSRHREGLEATLDATGKFAVTQHSEDTLNGVYSETEVQFLHADAGGKASRLLGEPSRVEGLRVAGLPDLIATKLKVVAQRGELRDYFDLMKLEQLAWSHGSTLADRLLPGAIPTR